MVFNINNIVRSNQASLYPNQEIIFENVKVEWKLESREPVKTKDIVILQGRLQPVDTQTLEQLNFNITEKQYFRLYLSSINETQADKIRQLGTTTFFVGNIQYQIVGKLPWDTNNWRELYCYVIDKVVDDIQFLLKNESEEEQEQEYLTLQGRLQETQETITIEIEEEEVERTIYYCFLDYISSNDKTTLKLRGDNILIYKEQEYLLVENLYKVRDLTKLKCVLKVVEND